MPSPFPGMDPYIEQPDLWPDFHNRLADEMSARLNTVIRPRYVARLTPYTVYEIIAVDRPRGVRPDFGVWQVAPEREQAAAVATITPAPVESLVPVEVETTYHRVEIRDTEQRRLVTVVEILSPANKRPGHKAQQEFLE